MLEAAAAAVGVGKTTIPNFFSLGHQRRKLTKVYVPALHHNDNLIPKLDICADGQPRVMGEMIEWLKTPASQRLPEDLPMTTSGPRIASLTLPNTFKRARPFRSRVLPKACFEVCVYACACASLGG